MKGGDPVAEWNLDYQYLTSLVKLAQDGESDAFAELYLATYKMIYRFAYRYLRNEQDAQDAVQDTYIIVLRKIRMLKDPQLFVSWLNQIAFRVCFGIQKKKKEVEGMEGDMAQRASDLISAEGQPEETAIRIGEKDFIIRQILSLPFSESQVLILRYYDEMKIDEIASLLDISRSSVKRYLTSGKEKLGLLIER